MSIVTIFDSQLTAEEYDRIVQGLEEAGLGAPDGRMHHVAWQGAEGWHVVDVWESEEKFGRFGEVLMPLMAGMGISVPPPKIYPSHNVMVG